MLFNKSSQSKPQPKTIDVAAERVNMFELSVRKREKSLSEEGKKAHSDRQKAEELKERVRKTNQLQEELDQMQLQIGAYLAETNDILEEVLGDLPEGF